MNMLMISLNSKVDQWPTAAEWNARIEALKADQTTFTASLTTATGGPTSYESQVNTLKDTTLPDLAN